MRGDESRRSQRQRRPSSQTSRRSPDTSVSTSPPAPTVQLSHSALPLSMECSAGRSGSIGALQLPSNSEADTRPELTEQQVRGLVLGSRNSKKAKLERLRGAVKQQGLIREGMRAAQMASSAAMATAAPVSSGSSSNSSVADSISYQQLAANHIFVTRIMEPDAAERHLRADLQQLEQLSKQDLSDYKKSKIRDHPSRLD